jgi:dipeptidyl aminopeptidase/acylaminoacyl peptidase
MHRNPSRWAVLFLLLIAGLPLVAAEGYRLPPQEVVDLVTAEPAPRVSFSPDDRWMVWTERDALPSIQDLSRRMLRLAGIRIDPVTNGGFRTSYDRGFEIRSVETGEVLTRVELEDGEGLARTSWSHTSKVLAYSVVSSAGTHLYTLQIDGLKTRRHPQPIMSLLGGFSFMPDGETLLVHLVPADRGAEPAAPTVPSGPNIQESAGNTSPTRTYQDLLSNPHDEALFEYYATSQLALISLDGSVKKLGKPGIRSASVSPDGRYLMVESIRRPFSYLLAFWGFPSTIEIWDLDGKVVSTIEEVPLADNIPIGGVRTGRRDVEWMTSADATLIWAEALDGGDPKREVSHRDQLFIQLPPFVGEGTPLLKVEHRSSGVTYLADPTKIITNEYDRDRRWIRSLLYDLKKGGDPRVFVDRSLRDRYGDPGNLVMHPDPVDGRYFPIQDGDWVYLRGRGASPKGNLPFLDRRNLKTLETERLWRCEEGTYESIVGIVKSSAGAKPTVITLSETPTTPPNYKMTDLANGSARKLTDFPDPTPQIRGVKKELVKYEREDGVPLSATLYLPADYKEGTQLPLLVWAYPIEFSDAKTAGQVTATPSRFTRIGGSSHLTLLTQGYAIMDAATMPVIGDAETMNDTFIDQIVGAAQAAIDKAVELGVADGKHVGVGGHSYGAFMTGNLLAHSDLFQAGLARSGAYNRTLTPFGFQSERRPLWEAKSVYFGISPFLHADKINEPILLIHGEKDNNSGTFPMQSKRMYQAIKGNGGTVRLVMLPEESHGYRAKESVLHVQAEMIDWFDRFLKEE